MATEAPSGPGIQVGPTSEFSLFFTVKPGHGEALRETLRALQAAPGYRPGDYDLPIRTIHEARFVPFDNDTRQAISIMMEAHWRSAVHPDRIEGIGAFNDDRDPHFQDPDY